MNENEALFSIGEVADMLSVNTSTIRYYDKQGLLPFVAKSPSGQRVFSAFDISWLKLIQLFKLSGLQLSEIRDMIDLGLKLDDTLAERKALYRRVKQRIEDRMASLATTKSIVDFYLTYYEMAEEAGSLAAIRTLTLDAFPADTRQLIQDYDLILPVSPFEEALKRQSEE